MPGDADALDAALAALESRANRLRAQIRAPTRHRDSLAETQTMPHTIHFSELRCADCGTRLALGTNLTEWYRNQGREKPTRCGGCLRKAAPQTERATLNA